MVLLRVDRALLALLAVATEFSKTENLNRILEYSAIGGYADNYINKSVMTILGKAALESDVIWKFDKR